MPYHIALDKNKSIGKVVFIVEGDKKEHTLLGHIFKEILDYSVVDVKRHQPPYQKYVSKSNADSRVFLVSSEKSNVKSAGEDGREYLDRVFEQLFVDYSLEISNAAVYYLFDRDNESNLYCETESLTTKLKNSRDNGYESNGLLLISYPCIEAYIKSCIDDACNELVDKPKRLKELVGGAKYQYGKIDEGAILKACNSMLLGIRDICERDLTAADLDDFSEIGGRVLSEENQLYLDCKQYRILSLLSVAFLDLGILSIVV